MSHPTGSSPASMATYARVSNLKKVNNNAGNGNGLQQNQQSTSRNVRFADEQTSSNSSTSGSTSSTSGPSSIESVQRNNNGNGNNLYDETLVVIEKSNKELEKKLTQPQNHQQQQPQAATSKQPPPLLIRPRLVDTIHNNKNSLAQEIIYEVEPGSETLQPQQNQPLNKTTTASTKAVEIRGIIILLSLLFMAQVMFLKLHEIFSYEKH